MNVDDLAGGLGVEVDNLLAGWGTSGLLVAIITLDMVWNECKLLTMKPNQTTGSGSSG